MKKTLLFLIPLLILLFSFAFWYTEGTYRIIEIIRIPNNIDSHEKLLNKTCLGVLTKANKYYKLIKKGPNYYIFNLKDNLNHNELVTLSENLYNCNFWSHDIPYIIHIIICFTSVFVAIILCVYYFNFLKSNELLIPYILYIFFIIVISSTSWLLGYIILTRRWI